MLQVPLGTKYRGGVSGFQISNFRFQVSGFDFQTYKVFEDHTGFFYRMVWIPALACPVLKNGIYTVHLPEPMLHKRIHKAVAAFFRDHHFSLLHGGEGCLHRAGRTQFIFHKPIFA